ncbi:5-formyltetrahydrofolate cyclo-ligase [bacterium]|nr:5-formyltetrahydrofolate cyclo-ligase [bacterium]
MKESIKSCQTFSKDSLRSFLVKKRLNMSDSEIAIKSNSLQELFLEKISSDNSIHSIALYSSINKEVRTGCIHNNLILNNKKIFYPKIVGNNLKFVESNNLNAFSVGKFNIMEPESDKYALLGDIDLFVLPSVGIGSLGKRLGYGGGFYDRVLSSIKKEKICSFIYDFQVIENFFGENHDIEASKVFTEKRVIYFN